MTNNEQQIALFVATYKPYAIETERKTGISHLFIFYYITNFHLTVNCCDTAL